MEGAEVGDGVVFDDGRLVLVIFHPLLAFHRLEPALRLGAGNRNISVRVGVGEGNNRLHAGRELQRAS